MSSQEILQKYGSSSNRSASTMPSYTQPSRTGGMSSQDILSKYSTQRNPYQQIETPTVPPPPQQTTPVAWNQPSSGFLQDVGRGVAAPLLWAGGRVGGLVSELIKPGSSQKPVSFDVPGLGQTTINPPTNFKQDIGMAVQVPALAVKSPVLGGAAFLGGQALSENKSLPESAAWAAGGAIGGKLLDVGITSAGKLVGSFGGFIKNVGTGSQAVRSAAETDLAKVLAPTTKAMKTKATAVLPGLAERKVVALTRKGLLSKAEQGLASAGRGLEEAYNALPPDSKVAINPIFERITGVQDKLSVNGVLPMANKAQHDMLGALKEELLKIAGDPNAPLDVIRSYRQHLDGIIEAAGKGFAFSPNDKAVLSAQKTVANTIRNELAKQYPDIAKVNNEFTFWKRITDVLNATIQRTKSQSSLGSHIMTGAGIAGGLASGGVSKAVEAGILMKNLFKLTNSTGWRTVSAAAKTTLADALAKGETGIAGNILEGIAKGVGVTLEKVGNLIGGVPQVRKDIAGQAIGADLRGAVKKNVNELMTGGPIGPMGIRDVSKYPLEQTLRGTKGMTAQDIMAKHPDIKLTRDVPATDVYGNKVKIPDGEVLTPYEMKGNKILLQDGETYIVSKSQFQNIKGNAVSKQAIDFAPELKGTEETVMVDNTAARDKLYAQADAGEITIAQRNAGIDKLGKPNKTKFSSYQLPDGKNYKEILIKAPIGKVENNVKNSYNNETSFLSDAPTFKSSHWDEPNVISHLRMNERTYKGKKVAFMEELQSDWAREGRSKGFSSHDPVSIANFDKYHSELAKKYDINPLQNVAMYKSLKNIPEAEIAKYDQLSQLAGEAKQGIPNNPLLKNWQELSIKRALKEAVDSDAEYFAWINGEQTSARYNLATHLKSADWKTNGQGSRWINLKRQEGGSDLRFVVHADGKVGSAGGGVPAGWIGKNLDEVLGKGLADKIMEKESGMLSGQGLKFGGEWANNLYDRQVGNIVSDLTGAKVETLDLGLPVGKEANSLGWRLLGKGEKGGALMLDEVGAYKKMKVGEYITRSDATDWIVTDILGDGKFKAVPKSHVDAVINDKRYTTNKTIPEAIKYLKKVAPSGMETFDISTKTTTQQGIRLTPEIKAKIRGEAPNFSASGKQFASLFGTVGGAMSLLGQPQKK